MKNLAEVGRMWSSSTCENVFTGIVLHPHLNGTTQTKTRLLLWQWLPKSGFYISSYLAAAPHTNTSSVFLSVTSCFLPPDLSLYCFTARVEGVQTVEGNCSRAAILVASPLKTGECFCK